MRRYFFKVWMSRRKPWFQLVMDCANEDEARQQAKTVVETIRAGGTRVQLEFQGSAELDEPVHPVRLASDPEPPHH